MKLKICGIRDIDILQYACEAGIDFVGFIMANESPRKISNDLFTSLERIEIVEKALFNDLKIVLFKVSLET